MKIELPDKIVFVLNTLEAAGYEAFVVGGCVRDCVLGIEPQDYDVTTNALPEQTLECFSGYTVIKTGIKHGTVTLVLDGENIEITTYRIDENYTDNRHPETVRFTSNLKDDVKRRDFTVNSMAYNPKFGLVDYFGGLEDARKGVISCVGVPDVRFNEDGLRVLRAIRFASVLGFKIDDSTAKSVHKSKSLLLNISAERIFSEFKKMLCGQSAPSVLREFVDVVGVFIPEILETVGFEQHTRYHCYDVFEHILSCIGNVEPDHILRLAAFFHDIGKPNTFSLDDSDNGHFYGHNEVGEEIASRVLLRLKADNYTRNAVKFLVREHGRQIENTSKSVRRLISKFGFNGSVMLLKIKRADIIALAPEYRAVGAAKIDALEETVLKIYRSESCFSVKSLHINGSDIITLGVNEGKEIGEILNRVLDAVLNEEVINERESLLKFAETLVSDYK